MCIYRCFVFERFYPLLINKVTWYEMRYCMHLTIYEYMYHDYVAENGHVRVIQLI